MPAQPARFTRKEYDARIAAARAMEAKADPGVVHFCKPGRGTEHAGAVLGGFTGTLQVDGYASYTTLAGGGTQKQLALAHCWAHGRQQLCEIFDRDASQPVSYA